VKIIVGLGNPGKKYVNTRHNIGFMAVDEFVKRQNCSFKRSWRFSAQLAELKIRDEKVLVVKPRTYMNLSGVAVRGIISFYRVAGNSLMVVYDDVAIPLGRFRFRDKGSAGGHNGINSIINALKTDVFDRLRIGIGDSGEQSGDLADYVLDEFSSSERKKLPDIIACSAELCDDWLCEDKEQLKSKYNGLEVC